ncbi:MAG: heme NO-binding domain-containing protein [Nannocystaceae bacterium]
MHEILLNFVTTNLGEGAADELRRRAGVEGQTFRLDTAYDDGQWRRLLAAAVDMAGGDAEAVETAFAHYAGEDLSLRFSGFFRGAKSAREMIARQPVIHNSLATGLSEDARRVVADKFTLEDRGDALVMHYRSANKHCTIYIGLARWVAEHFGERLEIRHERCMKRGADECAIELRFPDA